MRSNSTVDTGYEQHFGANVSALCNCFSTESFLVFVMESAFPMNDLSGSHARGTQQESDVEDQFITCICAFNKMQKTKFDHEFSIAILDGIVYCLLY